MSADYDRFLASIEMNYERWHDGTGMDLAAIDGMTADERQAAITLLRGMPQTWRETEAIQRLTQLGTDGTDGAAAWEATLRARVSDNYLSLDDRLVALAAMEELGQSPDYDVQLAALIRKLRRIDPGLTRALLMAEARPSDTIKQALLWASWNQTEAAPHCAALLCYLAGVTHEPFDFSRRSLFLQLGLNERDADRRAAFAELCTLVQMTLEPTTD